MPNTVKIIPYNPQWPEIYQEEAQRLKQALGINLIEIYHIGSTSIPMMPAKPVIDILIACMNLDDIEQIKTKLEQLDYLDLRRQIIPFQSYFVKRQDEDIRFHLHIHEVGSPQIKRHVNFRDYLIYHPEDAQEYAALKIQLAEMYSNEIQKYVLGKDTWVQALDKKAKQWTDKARNYHEANRGPRAELWSQEKILKAMISNCNVNMTHFAQYMDQVDLIRIPGYTIVNSGLPDDTFNYVIDADFPDEYANEKITTITEYFSRKNIPFSWWIAPLDNPEDLAEILEKNAYKNTNNNTVMYMDLDAWEEHFDIPKGLEIIQAKDEKSLQDFANVLTNDKVSFNTYFSWIAHVLTDDDPIEYYVGYINGKPVVRGLSCHFGQVAGFHWLSTAPEERGKGYGAAMQTFRLNRAKELGYHIAGLQASDQGYSLYKRLGYKECGKFREFKLILNGLL